MGAPLGPGVGGTDGPADGSAEGSGEGPADGVADGLGEGPNDGSAVGCGEGIGEGTGKGIGEGIGEGSLRGDPTRFRADGSRTPAREISFGPTPPRVWRRAFGVRAGGDRDGTPVGHDDGRTVGKLVGTPVEGFGDGSGVGGSDIVGVDVGPGVGSHVGTPASSQKANSEEAAAGRPGTRGAGGESRRRRAAPVGTGLGSDDGSAVGADIGAPACRGEKAGFFRLGGREASLPTRDAAPRSSRETA